MAALLRAGLPLLQSLELMLERTENISMREVLTEIRDQVKSGADLSDAFAAFGDLFPALYPATLKAGVEMTLRVVGTPGGASNTASAVAMNIAAIHPAGAGYLQVYPCGLQTSSNISSINYIQGEVRTNSVVSPVGDGGQICLRSSQDADVVIDLTGYFDDVETSLDFLSLNPIRLFDSRSTVRAFNESTSGRLLAAGQTITVHVAGERGVPSDAQAVSINLTAAQPLGNGFVTAFPCGTVPATSTVNVGVAQGVAASGTMVKLSSSGDLCIYSSQSVHVVIDINGAWT